MIRLIEHGRSAPSPPLLSSSPPPPRGGGGVGVWLPSPRVVDSRFVEAPPHPDPLTLKGEKERTRRAKTLYAVAACFFSLTLSTPALAQSAPVASWPTKPIRLIVPLPAGSAVD